MAAALKTDLWINNIDLLNQISSNENISPYQGDTKENE